ncbi:MAG: M14 family murein peptide amidase A [Gallionellaceae bacterium]|nr:M14 family murein peptide amidase A [Gallionellaceae bacterium]
MTAMTRFTLYTLFAALALSSPLAWADPDPVAEWCDYLGKRLRSVSAKACHAQDFAAASQRTVQGNALVLRDIGPAAGQPAAGEPRRILVVGGIHGDELTSISVVFRWLDWIGQPEAAPYHWRVIPLANPDGLKARPSTRANANGVDLNRNFQTPDWEKDAQRYWVKRTRRDPRRYPGASAGSEVETRWLQDQIEEFRPDLIISVHAPYNLLDYDGPVPQPMRFGRLSLNRLGVYPGSMGNYAGVYKQIPVITIELPNATAMPSQRDQQAMWQDMHKWMRNNILALRSEPAVSGRTDSAPLLASKQSGK